MSSAAGNRFARAWAELTSRPAAAAPVAAPAPRVNRAIYRGAEVNRLLSDWITSCLTSDDELRGSLRVMRGRARDLARNDALVRQFLNLLAVNVIGHRGPRLQARVRDASGNLDRRVNGLIEEAWNDWAAGPVTADRKLPLVQYEHLQLRTTATDGESFTRYRLGMDRRHGLALQPIDADLVDEMVFRQAGADAREVRLGIEIDGDGGETGFLIRDSLRYLPGKPSPQHWRLDASEAGHHFLTERAHQMRGMTWLAAIMLLLQHLERYAEAELVAARAGAAAMAFIVQTDPGASGGDDDATQPRELALSPGTGVRLAPGEDVRDFTPSHPTTAYGTFTKDMTRRVATGLAMSYNALANDLEGVNYSSIRSGLLIEREVWRMLQEWWIASFRTPTYERWLEAAVLSGTLRLPSTDWRAYRAARWIPRGWAWVDPLKDAQAAQLALQNGLTSRARLLAERGEDYEEILEELAAETKLADAYGVTIGGAQVLTVPADSEDEPTDATDGKAEPAATRSGGIDRLVRMLRGRRAGGVPVTNGRAH